MLGFAPLTPTYPGCRTGFGNRSPVRPDPNHAATFRIEGCLVPTLCVGMHTKVSSTQAPEGVKVFAIERYSPRGIRCAANVHVKPTHRKCAPIPPYKIRRNNGVGWNRCAPMALVFARHYRTPYSTRTDLLSFPHALSRPQTPAWIRGPGSSRFPPVVFMVERVAGEAGSYRAWVPKPAFGDQGNDPPVRHHPCCGARDRLCKMPAPLFLFRDGSREKKIAFDDNNDRSSPATTLSSIKTHALFPEYNA
uniref:Uncharacterized protein n=1 Tax=Candidatus Kentrum sp. DK TaxID=2126562 RepID=A0A450RW89_9GAMM|nr:MAG: hypothetical protein BECKDK2373C_GA0170839_100543 [Candidatus Kentron sp. DK]